MSLNASFESHPIVFIRFAWKRGLKIILFYRIPPCPHMCAQCCNIKTIQVNICSTYLPERDVSTIVIDNDTELRRA